MARIRTMKPEMFKSYTVCAFPFEGRWLFAGLFTYCDDYGRGLDDPRLVKAEIFPLDDRTTAARVEGMLRAMSIGDDAPLCRYTGDDGRAYLHFPKWPKHQKPSHPTDSAFPPCPVHGGKDFRTRSRTTPESFANDSGWNREASPASRARAEQGTGNREQGREQGSYQDQVATSRPRDESADEDHASDVESAMAGLADAWDLEASR